MPQIFHRSMNTISRVTIFGAVFIIAAAVAVGNLLVRSPYATGAGVVKTQPVPFSHEHHAGKLGIDCRYCHLTVETSASAGIPAAEVCMDCHSQLYTDARMLEPVRQSYSEGTPLVWNRVHDVPDYACFEHSIHIKKGMRCEVCHGRVDRMPLMWRDATLLMEWCLDCHRNPEDFVAPRDAVFEMGWTPGSDDPSPEELIKRHQIRRQTDCSTCHR